MIVFELACGHGHRFEGWFASAEDFARQSEAQMVRCPVCDDASVVRVPSASVHVGRSVDRRRPRRIRPPRAAPAQEAIAGLPAELVSKLREIVRNTENVGARFPEEARKIHYDEAPARAIRGHASREEAEALADEGIDVASLPDFLLRDTH